MLRTRFREWAARLKRIAAMGYSVSAYSSSANWSGGLAVSPASFSRQLGDMHLSLLRANTSRSAGKQVVRGKGLMQTGGQEAIG